MSRRSRLMFALALSLSGASACDEAPAAGEVVSRGPGGYGGGGVLLNTNALGDHPMAELNIKGEVHESTVLEAVYLRRTYKAKTVYAKLDKVWAEKDGEIWGALDDELYHGSAFAGSRWELLTYSGGLKPRTMFVHSYRLDATDGLHKYVFAYPDDPAYGPHFYVKESGSIDGTGLKNSCADDPTTGLEAIVYADLHVDMKTGQMKASPDLINIACLSGGVGKAGLWGYTPQGVDLEGFETAVRTVRADYCGDGGSFTKPGNALTLEDRWQINTHPDPNAKTEAIWTVKGAACVGQPREVGLDPSDIDCDGVTPKQCDDAKLGDFGDDLMWSKIP